MAVAIFSSPALTRRVMRLLARRRTPAFAPYWMVTPAALAVVTAFATGSLSLVGVELNVLPLTELEARAADLMLAPDIATVATASIAADIAPPARKPATSRRLLPAKRAQIQPVSPTIPDDLPAAAVQPTDPTEGGIGSPSERSAAPSMASAVHAAPEAPANVSAAFEAAAPLQSPDVTTEARDAWVAATLMGESIGRSSRKGAVSTAGFFTRISKRIATSF